VERYTRNWHVQGSAVTRFCDVFSFLEVFSFVVETCMACTFRRHEELKRSPDTAGDERFIHPYGVRSDPGDLFDRDQTKPIRPV
jgi:hypothetical protein